MIKCPRCEFPVDETTRTTCPLCFTPIAAAGQTPPQPGAQPVPDPSRGVQMPHHPPAVPVAVPTPPEQGAQPGMMPPPMPQGMPMPPTVPQMPPQQPAPMPPQGYTPPAQQTPPVLPGMGQPPQMPPPQAAPPPAAPGYAPGAAPRPGVRVSLTGEVIDDSMTNNAPPPSYVGGGAAPPPRPVGTARPTGMNRPVQETPSSGSGAGIAIVLVVILLLGGVGFGGWWFMTHPRSNPKENALHVYTAMLKGDWATAYDYMDKSGASNVPSKEAFVKLQEDQINANPTAKMGIDLLKNSTSDYKVGEPVINGTEADVPTSCKMTIMGQSLTFKGTAHMVYRGGKWLLKVGGDYSSGLKSGQDLIGKPDNLPGGMGGGGMMGGGMVR